MRSKLSFFQSGPDVFALLAQAFTPVQARQRKARPAPGLLERIERWLTESKQRELEAYLAQSTDVYDLEARQRAFERGQAWRGFPEH